MRRVIATFGDVALLDFDGAILYRDGGEYRLDFWEMVCMACGGPIEDGCRLCRENWQRYQRYDVRTVYVAEDIHADHPWLTDEHIVSMSQSLGIDWRALARSSDVRERAQAVLAIGDYFGPDNLDSYPVRMSRSELFRHRPFYRGAVKKARVR